MIIGHCQSYPHHEYHAEIARRGAYVAFDRLGTVNPYEHELDLMNVKKMIDAGLTRNVLFGQDVCRRSDYTAYGGKGYGYITDAFLKELRELGVKEEELTQITVDNPRRALTGED